MSNESLMPVKDRVYIVSYLDDDGDWVIESAHNTARGAKLRVERLKEESGDYKSSNYEVEKFALNNTGGV